jgi:phage terminase large subunit-like protein
MSKPFQPTPHPVLRLPTAAEALALGSQKWAEVMARRERIIAEEKADPFRHCYTPPIWRVADALLGFPWVDPVWAKAMREHLGFPKPVSILLINGGQRGSKSQYAGNRTMKVLAGIEAAKAWALHSTLQMSRDYQQPIFWHYMPPELKNKDIKERTVYIAYKQKTGFSEEKFVLPPLRPGVEGSDLLFKAYEQDKKSIEGGNLNLIWPDELVPSDWVETMELRIAQKNGVMIITFTPVEGYSETVRMFQDGAEVVKESTAFLCPRDGGPPDPARALGLTPEEYAELQAAERENRPSLVPQSIPENCDAWLEGKSGQPEIPPGRDFERVPRVMKCADGEGKRAVLFFHSADNPYGNPKNIWSTIAGKPTAFIKERFYGVASKTLSARFAKFDHKIHVIPDAALPNAGTRYLIVDPCGGRNLFLSWFLVTPEAAYLYREWPGNYVIPGVGMPGPWALPDGRKPDGRPGPAQKSFGWGLLDYKREIARLERWKDYCESGTPDQLNPRNWDEAHGAAEIIEERLLDSRFASVPRIEADRPKTLLTEFEEIGLFFKPTPGDVIEDGALMIDAALAYDPDQPLSYFNKPKFYIAASCTNTIYSMATWTGVTREGRRCMDGATKDPIDNVRYFQLADCPYLGSHEPADHQEAESEENYY